MFVQRWADIATTDTALLLSGGVDSMTALFAALECGHKPRCYTFYLSGYKSTDLAAARKVTDYFGLELIEVGIPSTLGDLIRDTFAVIDEINWEYYLGVRKVTIQTMHPLLYTTKAIEERKVVAGLGGGKLSLDSRKASIEIYHGGEEAADDLRCDRYAVDDDSLQYQRTYQRAGIEYLDFYAFTDAYRWVREIPVIAFNQRKAKWGLVKPFLDYWKKRPMYRAPAPYQIASGLRRFHDRLLKTRWNTKGWVQVQKVYQQMAKERGVRFGAKYYFPVQIGPYRHEVHVASPRIRVFYDASTLAEF